jgi:flagellar biosynthetic protein FliR
MTLTFPETETYLFLMVFCRMGSAIMSLPGIGDHTVPPRIRLVFALALSFILLPVVGHDYPPLPAGLGALIGLMFGEIACGLALGLIIRMFMMALDIAGTLIASQTGLAFAQNFDPTIGIQGALLTSFFTMMGVTLVMQMDLHHLMLAGLEQSYNVLKPGAGLPWNDFADLATRTFSLVFRIGVEMAAPFIVFSLVFYAASGVVARLLPQIQVFFLVVPLNILAGFALLMVLIGSMMMLFLNQFGHALSGTLF